MLSNLSDSVLIAIAGGIVTILGSLIAAFQAIIIKKNEKVSKTNKEIALIRNKVDKKRLEKENAHDLLTIELAKSHDKLIEKLINDEVIIDIDRTTLNQLTNETEKIQKEYNKEFMDSHLAMEEIWKEAN